MRKTIEHLFSSEAVLDRISMVVIVGNSRQRVFKEGLSKLSDWTQMAISEFTLESSRPVIIRRLLNTVEDQERCSTVGKRSSPPLTSDHRDLGVRSVIDVHLWDQAGWNGTAFTHWGPSYPPAIALMFKHEDAARKIFSRWRQRLGTVDKQDEIYLAILRGISVDEPAHYRVLITSRLSNDEGETSGKTFMMASRMQTMHAETDVNLIRFLNIYRQSRAYLLLPAIFNGRAEPKFIPELAILKRELSVKNAIEVNEHDVEVMALGAEEYRRRFGTSGPGNRS